MSAPTSTAEAAPAAARLGTILITLCAAAACLVLATHGAAMVAWPYQADYGEGVALALTDAWRRGEPLYRDPAIYPWRADPYAPIYTMLCASLAPWLGVSLAAGRLVSWLAALGVLACLTLAAAQHGGSASSPDGQRPAAPADDGRRLAAMSAAAFFVVSPLIVGWAALYRVDFLALLFEVLGVLAVDWALRHNARGEASSTRCLALAAPLFACAFLTKQSYILGFLAACVCVLRVDPRRGAAFFVWGVGCIAAAFAILASMTGGAAMFASLFTHNVMPWRWEHAWPWISQYAVVVALPLLVALLGAGGADGVMRLWRTYLVLAALTLVGVGRLGAYYNHFLPFAAALSVVAGVAVTQAGRTRRRAGLVLLLTLGQVAGVGMFCRLEPTLPAVSQLARSVRGVVDGTLPRRIDEAQAAVRADVERLARFPGDVVAENMALAVMAGRSPVLCDPSTLFAMAQAGHWNEAAFVEAVRAHRFGVIILQRTGPDNLRFSARALQAISQEYVPAATIAGDQVLVPRAQRRAAY